MRLKDSTVPEHLDIKSDIGSRASPETFPEMIFVKLRPFGRSNNRRATWSIPSVTKCNSRDPVSLGEVRGASHSSVPFSQKRVFGVRSSRRGKEHRRPKTLECRRRLESKRSDLTEAIIRATE